MRREFETTISKWIFCVDALGWQPRVTKLPVYNIQKAAQDSEMLPAQSLKCEPNNVKSTNLC